jgi:sortase A
MRRALRLLAVVMIVAGGLLLADGVATLAWREPVTSVYAGAQQDKLDARLRVAERAGGARRAATRVARAARAARRRAEAGDPIGRLSAPAIGLRAVVVEGTAPADLRRAPGHYAGTALPGGRGTVAVAGHRTTYGAPFRRLDELRRGDRVELAMPYGRFVYRVERTRVVPPAATWVTRRASYDRLVLTACHPLWSAAERIVVFARLVRAPTAGM